MKIFIIYGLIDPTSKEVRYIGKTTTSLKTRLNNHLYKVRSKRDKSKKAIWIQELFSKNQVPEIVELYKSSEEDWKEKERKFISQYPNLVNSTRGGNGAHSRKQLPLEIQEQLGKISDTELAKQTEFSRENITYHRRKLGIPACPQNRSHNFDHRKGKSPHNKIDLPQSIIDRLGKESAILLAKEANCSITTINAKCKELGIPVFRQIPFKGEEHSMSKLNKSDVQIIRNMFKEGITRREIAKNFNINYAHCCSIISHKSWR